MSFVELFGKFFAVADKEEKIQSWTKYMAKMAFYSPSPISMLFAPIHVFLREDFPENSNIDIGGGTSVPNN